MDTFHSTTRPRPAYLGYDSDNCTDGFLEPFIKAQNRKSHPKEQLTALQHAAFHENVDLVAFMTPVCVDNTKFNVTGILRKWKTYVDDIQSKLPLTHTLHRCCQF